MAESFQQLARNQTLFREVNERISDLANVSGAEFVCECGLTDCTATIALDGEEYEAIRSSPTLFFIAPGHQTPGEGIIEQNERFALVEKTNRPQIEIAIGADPRSRRS